MSLSTNSTREAFVSIPAEPWPKLVIHEFIDSPELGTEANSIVIRDVSATLGSASIPIVGYIDEDCGYGEMEPLVSDADTDIMATPEFLENLT
ncbi:hypothetical protein N7537_011163 [Penicillium hordei]|uniref:Uncharacterized protein n=1 Tax=Penicillium hordei TaxID=40994 RepID=A0AAD6DL82_9EURO|nr:uncharacterized protein N7537_011163 [Penicillium hordei]KAJ5588485.1 hypothetical protein N7537_011163 [Penicillium hordei]